MYNGCLDGSTGELMIGSGNRKFSSASCQQKGFILTGDVRDLKPLVLKTNQYILAARNNDSLQVLAYPKGY